MRVLRLFVVAVVLLSCRVAGAQNWPQWRGAEINGIVVGNRIPVEWAADQNILWKVELPGVGWSQPIVWGNKVFVTTAVTENQSKPLGGGEDRGRRDRDAPPSQGPAAAGDSQQAEGPRPDAKPDRPDSAGDEGNREGRRPRGNYQRASDPPDAIYRWLVICLDADSGRVLWEKLAHEGRPTIPIHRTNTYASETPATDGKHVYAYFGMTGLFCYDLSGNLVWKRDLGSYPMMFGWGTGSSPVLYEDRLYLQCDNEKKSFLVALDKRTGDELWRIERDEKSNWSTPYIWKNKDRVELVVGGGKEMRAYDPTDGKLLWELAGLRGRCSATPAGTQDLVVMGVGGGMGGSGPLVAVEASAKGALELPKNGDLPAGLAWAVPRSGPPMASPLIYRDLVYILEQRGIVGCFDVKSGKEHHRQRIEGAASFTSSPWAYDGRVFCLDEQGQTFVLAAGPELKVLGVNKLDDSFWSSAAVADNRLLLRGMNALYCIGDSQVAQNAESR